MITKQQEELITALHDKKGRREYGLCLVEGPKILEVAGSYIEFIFTRQDTKKFDALVTTETPQDIAAVAHIPQWKREDILSRPTIVVLDGVQDPGNVGAILRLCLGFNASLVLIDSADPASPKVIRASAGALFQTPWIVIPRDEALQYISDLDTHPLYRLEVRPESVLLGRQSLNNLPQYLTIIVGSEGHGISLDVKGTSLKIGHSPLLESLNVGQALSIFLGLRSLQ